MRAERVELLRSVLEAATRRARRRGAGPELLGAADCMRARLQGLSDEDLEAPAGRPPRPTRAAAWELIDELRAVSPR